SEMVRAKAAGARNAVVPSRDLMSNCLREIRPLAKLSPPTRFENERTDKWFRKPGASSAQERSRRRTEALTGGRFVVDITSLAARCGRPCHYSAASRGPFAA